MPVLRRRASSGIPAIGRVRSRWVQPCQDRRSSTLRDTGCSPRCRRRSRLQHREQGLRRLSCGEKFITWAVGRSWYACCSPLLVAPAVRPEKGDLMLEQNLRTCGLALAVAAAVVLSPHAQSETFTATASIKTAGGAAASAPVTIVVDRKMPQAEADKFLAAFKSGGTAALRKALTGVAPTGSVTSRRRIGRRRPG